jgi:hypothetical protein
MLPPCAVKPLPPNAEFSFVAYPMELDHLFFLADPRGKELALLQEVGLRETYRRVHSGQGTANVCFAFENAFLELLWVTDAEEAKSNGRTGLLERSRWRSDRTCPFGIAWRGAIESLATWKYTPPYLPPGVAIDVACDSDDFSQPMLFTFPGARSPIQWPAERHQGFQHEAGFTRIEVVELSFPQDVKPCAAVQTLSAKMNFEVTSASDFSARLRLSKRTGESTVLHLPSCRLS